MVFASNNCSKPQLQGALIKSFLLQLSIGKQWKEFLDYSDSIGFIFHVRIFAFGAF